MAQLTRRQKIRIRSHFQMAVTAAAALLIVGAVVFLLVRLFSGGAEKAQAALSEPVEQTAEEPAAAEPESEEDPLPAVDIASWELRLVRADTPLASDFVPELMEIERGEYFDKRAGAHLMKLIADARAEGYSVYVCSGYRSYDTQYEIYWNHVWNYEQDGLTREQAEAATRLAVNYPGGSEHQLGLAMDLLEFQDQTMEPWIGGSGLMLWLEAHCADYGFIIRYPDGKTDITGVEYEPWHLRYVGTAARYIMEHGLCLEEFLALYEP